MSKTTSFRPCRVCSRLYEDPGPGRRTAPAGICSKDCHQRGTPIKAAKRKAVSPASPSQRLSVKDRACVVCRGHQGWCHPAHLIDRSLCSEGADDPRAVVPLCPAHHRAYDEEGMSLLEYLEPHFRPELAFAVERVGLLATLRRVTNDKGPGA